ncbi:MAG: ribonuclease III [Elusimicrobia bacterium]|nr:ribonuclease III [Elusimicrobiota bacterium]
MQPRPIEEVLKRAFRRREFLEEALTHKSFATEKKLPAYNERLEFLGDSILSAVVVRHLFEAYPQEDEGLLSKRKAALVSKASLAAWAAELDLGEHLKLGVGEESSGGRKRPSLLANVLEAVIGAIFLDGGFDSAAAFIMTWLENQTDIPKTDFKSRLQEIVQKRFKVPPHYRVAEERGPDHDKTFWVSVHLNKHFLGEGSGKNKKEAEQAAARDALSKVVSLSPENEAEYQ